MFLSSEGTVQDRGHGGEDAFQGAALACLDGLFGFAMALTRDRAAAEDLVQETYLRALSARHKAEPGENLRGWLFTILHNAWRNQVRRPRLEQFDPREGGGGPSSAVWLSALDAPDEELDRVRLRDALWRAIAGLPDHFREVVVLRCVESFSYQEIASIVGCPTGTVMSRLARGRALLRERFPAGSFPRPAREAAR